MVLDSERQKEILIALIKQATFSGLILDEIYTLKKAIDEAEINGGNP